MAALEAERSVLHEELMKEEKILAGAEKVGDVPLIEVCHAKNSRDLNKCKADAIRTWSKLMGIKRLSRVSKLALIKKIAWERGFKDTNELVSDPRNVSDKTMQCRIPRYAVY
jgi:hypothetical protein